MVENVYVNSVKDKLIFENVELLVILQSLIKPDNSATALNHEQQIKLIGLMKRLLNQIPTRDPCSLQSTNSGDLAAQFKNIFLHIQRIHALKDNICLLSGKEFQAVKFTNTFTQNKENVDKSIYEGKCVLKIAEGI